MAEAERKMNKKAPETLAAGTSEKAPERSQEQIQADEQKQMNDAMRQLGKFGQTQILMGEICRNAEVKDWAKLPQAVVDDFQRLVDAGFSTYYARDGHVWPPAYVVLVNDKGEERKLMLGRAPVDESMQERKTEVETAEEKIKALAEEGKEWKNALTDSIMEYPQEIAAANRKLAEGERLLQEAGIDTEYYAQQLKDALHRSSTELMADNARSMAQSHAQYLEENGIPVTPHRIQNYMESALSTTDDLRDAHIPDDQDSLQYALENFPREDVEKVVRRIIIQQESHDPSQEEINAYIEKAIQARSQNLE